MTRSNLTSIKVTFISALLVLGLTLNTARADHYESGIAPIATFIFLNSLFRHNHNHGYQRHHRDYRHGHSHKRHGHSHKRHGHSQSYGGYSHKAKRIHKRRDYRG